MLRFGIYDEAGYPGDPLYPSQYMTGAGAWRPTRVSDAEVAGTWVHPSGQATPPCVPGPGAACVHHPRGPNTEVTCDLGSVPLLPQVTSYCRPEQVSTKNMVTMQKYFLEH